MEFKRQVTTRKSLTLTPLIDIIFLLIVFFLLTSEFSLMQSLDIELTTIENSDTPPDAPELDKTLLISLHQDGTFELNGIQHPISYLEIILQKTYHNSPPESVVIHSGEGVYVQHVISTMEALQANGIQDISVSNIMNKEG